MWSNGCIFAKILTGRPLFRGKKSMTDLFATPLTDTIFAGMMLLFMKILACSSKQREKSKRYPF